MLVEHFSDEDFDVKRDMDLARLIHRGPDFGLASVV